ncbi:MAG: replication initiator protein [Microvirus sp.]|nr:MAG: replication initiator protein [Microvirus sp.]
MHESALHSENCFITLTYARDTLPPNGSLEHKDFQKFIRSVRKKTKRNIRYYVCGEYGPENQRPHYHACIFGLDFHDRIHAGTSASGEKYYESETLSALWKHGRCSVQDLNTQTAGYCSRYIMTKALGETAKTAYQKISDTGELIQLAPEYAKMSLKPGLGQWWYQKYQADIHKKDKAIDATGKVHAPPRYYDKLLKRRNAERLEELQEARATKAKQQTEDQTPERLAVREIVHEAKLKTLKRNMT